MRTIRYEQLKDLRNGNEDFILINVLPAEQFNKAHIPGSINIPGDQPDFIRQVERSAGRNDRKIVLYCADIECNASRNAAKKLDSAGFTNVFAYEGGIQEWQEKSGKRKAA